MASLHNRLRRAQEGMAYLEFAITLPFLVLLFMGAVELTRYIIIVQKVEKATMTVSDVVAQSETIGTTQLNTLVEAAEKIMLPYAFGSGGYVIVSCVSKTGTAAPKVLWQYKGGGTWTKTSQVGAVSANAVLPSGFTMVDKESVIIAEVFYNYTPMFSSNVLSPGQIYKLAVFRPRLGDLTTLGP